MVMMGVQSTTHWVDGGIPRRLVLPSQQSGTTVIASLPSDPNVVPLGHYMVFAMVDCFPDGICFNDMFSLNCIAIDGQFHGIGMDCFEDTDNDGVIGCDDQCPLDFYKTLPGLCGCGVSDSTATSGAPGVVVWYEIILLSEF